MINLNKCSGDNLEHRSAQCFGGEFRMLFYGWDKWLIWVFGWKKANLCWNKISKRYKKNKNFVVGYWNNINSSCFYGMDLVLNRVLSPSYICKGESGCLSVYVLISSATNKMEKFICPNCSVPLLYLCYRCALFFCWTYTKQNIEEVLSKWAF